MAAAVPLPPKEQRQAFLRYTHFLPRTSLCGYDESQRSVGFASVKCGPLDAGTL